MGQQTNVLVGMFSFEGCHKMTPNPVCNRVNVFTYNITKNFDLISSPSGVAHENHDLTRTVKYRNFQQSGE